MAFGQDPKTSYQVEAGKKIAKRYSGQPLMVKMVASILRTENSEADWRFFYENKFPTERIIKLCYEHLPSPLKHCLAYCSLFPNYHEYDVETIIKMWMAQGFVEPLTPDQSLEEAGYDYVLDLLERGFFQVSEIDVRERVIKFHMHHELVHRLAKVVAEGSCTKLRSHNHVYGRTIHVSLDHKDCDSTLFERILVENIRSIVFPFQSLRQQDSASIQGDQIFDIIISRFIKLRTLDLHAMGINAVPSSIKKLKLLKYLDLSQSEDIRELPNSITKLLHLQTLKLSSCYGLKKLPKGFKNLINLRHLEIDGCYNLTTLPRGISQLPNLQMLSQLVVTEDTSPNIGLNKWRKELHIKNLGHENFDLNKFVNVVSEVQSLMLEWESNVRESDEHKKPLNSDLLSALEELTLRAYKGKRLFSHNCPSNLVKLSLRKCANCQILPPLHQLPNLKVLVLDELPKLEYISDNASSLGTPFFPSLKELWLTELPMLQRWWRNEEPPSFYWQTNEVDFDEWLSFDLQINDVNFDESPSFDQQTNGEDDFDEWPASFGLVINDDVDFDEWLSFDRQIRDVNVDFDEWPINDIDFDELPKLKRWWRKEVDIHPLPSFPCLSKLVVEDCPTLVSMPMFPTLEEGLALDSTCWKPFQHTMFQDTVGNKDTQESPSQSPSLPLSKLKALRIVGIEHFKADEIEWQNLKSLQFLRFDCLPNLVSLPEWLQHVLSLQELHLWRCGTEEIPEWIGELQNLSKLVIFVCPHLKSLPKAIRKLQFLETLEIEECNDLLMRCKKDIGADWKKIRFIKNLHLGQIYEK
ncbi:putative disease resistance protein At3g14460 [Humulus lupulus]|uniref:putative disease resistance protein At3g14460 n=1 Tax=Humulus lupulus TaxID=3486 RepID=UPI002B406024|nr:putative disease resistance protein At3g14460 [Humulus lupulus]XP_062115450.1 putative disease resistance protein At3g14460 [Humulus lupulus]